MTTARPSAEPRRSTEAPAQVLRERLRTVYEIGQQLIGLEDEDETLAAVVALLDGTLPLRSVVVISALGGAPVRRAWVGAGGSDDEVRRARDEAAWAYAYLSGDEAEVIDPRGEPRPLRGGRGDGPSPRFVRLPLAAGAERVFGVLQLEASLPLEETDLFFVSAVVNQLGLALELHRGRVARRAREARRWRAAESARDAAETSLEETKERQQAADALRAHFEALVDHLDQAFLWAANASTLEVTYVSARAEALLGYPRMRWLDGGGPPLWWVHPDDRGRLRDALHEAVATGKDQRCDHRCVKADGDVLWFNTGVHVNASAGAPVLQAASIDVTAAIEERTVIREELDFTSAITHGLSDAILAMDTRFRVTFLNPAGERLIGLKREEVLGAPVRAILRIFRPDGSAVPDDESPWSVAMRTGEEQGSDVDTLAMPGRAPFAASYAAAPLERGGRVTGAVVLFHDVSERRRMEQALRDSERQFRELAQTLPQIVWTMRPDGVVDFVNDRWFEYTGQSMEARELGLDAWTSALHPDDRDRARAVALEAGSTQRDLTIEARLRRADGRYRWHLNRSVRIRARDGDLVKLVGTWTDVEDLKTAEAEARRQAARDAFLADVGASLGRSLDPQETAAAIARAAVPALADVGFVDLMGADGRLERESPPVAAPAEEAAAAELSSALASLGERGPRGWAVRNRAPVLVSDLARPAADTHLYGASVGRLRDAGATSMMVVPLLAVDDVLGVLTLFRTDPEWPYSEQDLSLAQELTIRASLAVDNARLYEAAQRAIGAREDILAIVAHDLRNPLGGLLTAASLLAEDVIPENRGVVAMIGRQAERMLRLVNDLLDWASLDAGRLALDKAPHEVAELVRAAFDAHRPAAEAKSVELVAELEDDGHCRVHCDADRIQQVLGNLLSNAIKFSPEGGAIVVCARVDGPDAHVSIADRGPGMMPEDAAHVFDRFWQAPGTARQGTGLGLAIAREIVQSHGGTIEVRSALGRGTTFELTLPLAG